MTIEQEPFDAEGFSVSLTVKDLEKSLAWYTETVGFTVGHRHEREGKLRAVELTAGSARMLIGRDDGAKGWDRAKGDGMSLYFRTKQDVDALAQRIKQSGTALDSEPMDMPWGARVFSLRDPDGFKLVIAREKSSA